MSTEVTPSTSARALFGQMVNLSDDEGKLSLLNTITLGVAVHRQGSDPQVMPEVAELRQEGWIQPAGDGGWLLGEGADSWPFLFGHSPTMTVPWD